MPGFVPGIPAILAIPATLREGWPRQARPGRLACSPRRFLGWLSRRRGEQREQRPPDRGLPRRRRDLRAGEIGDVEDVDHALAESRDMGRSNIEIELRQGRG